MRAMGNQRAANLLGIILVLTSLPAFASQAQEVAEGRFPVLNRLTAEGRIPVLSEDQRRELLDEVRIERLLWKDELARLRVRAEGSASAGVAEAMSCIDRVQAEVSRRLEVLEESINRGEIDEQLIMRVLSSGAGHENRPEYPVISGAGLRLPEPVHREVTLHDDLPPAYWEEPSAEYEAFRPKAAGEEDAVSLLAFSLSSDPVALYQHVLHEIDPVSAFGLSRSPEGVLSSGAVAVRVWKPRLAGPRLRQAPRLRGARGWRLRPHRHP